MKKEFTVHRRLYPASLRCAVRDQHGWIVISRRRDETHWRVWLNFPARIYISAPTLKATIVSWKLNR